MKRLLHILLVCVLFVACKSNDMEDLLSDRIASIETTYTVPSWLPSTIERLAFAYDGQGRLKKVNDKVFYYGVNGKVEFSRVFIESPHPHGKTVYIERLSYHWDAQGRLKEVYLDSLYRKTPAIPDGIVTGSSEDLMRNILLATYIYEGANRKPSTIVYRPQTRSGANIIAIRGEERIDYMYEGENVSSSILKGVFDISMLPIPHGGHPYQLTTINTFLPNMYPLAKVYNQLGFHPIDLSEVVSLNCVSTIQREFEMEDTKNVEFIPPENGGIKFNWRNNWRDSHVLQYTYPEMSDGKSKTTYRYQFNALELPTEIIEEGTNNMRRTIITYE